MVKNTKKDENEDNALIASVKARKKVVVKLPVNYERCLRKNVAVLKQAVATKTPVTVARVMQYNTRIRHNLTMVQLRVAVEKYLPENSQIRAQISKCIDALIDAEAKNPKSESSMDVDEPVTSDDTSTSTNESDVAETTKERDARFLREDTAKAWKVAREEEALLCKKEKQEDIKNPPSEGCVAEVEIYFSNLVASALLKYNLNAEASTLTTFVVDWLQKRKHGERTMDRLHARAFSLFSRACESRFVMQLNVVQQTLLREYRTACLQHNEIGQVTLLNLLLRCYINQSQFTRASKLVAKTNPPDSSTSNNQMVRYLYYVGRIEAIQLRYTESVAHLAQALRKCPANNGVVRFQN